MSETHIHEISFDFRGTAMCCDSQAGTTHCLDIRLLPNKYLK